MPINRFIYIYAIMLVHTFKKKEVIKSKKTIDYLFSGGATSFCSYPIRVVYKEQLDQSIDNHTILVSVSKRKFKHAVDRNRVKRLIRESYRLNKTILTSSPTDQNKHYALAFIYVSDKIFSFTEIQSAIQKLLILVKEESSLENA